MPAAHGDNKGSNFWLYVWLGISGLLNLSGMASIVDGFVTWAQFFRDFIDTYRWAIRDPLASIGDAIWPFGTIPGWVFDVFVLWSALFLAYNTYHHQIYGKSFFLGKLRRDFRVGPINGIFWLAVSTIFLPLYITLSALSFSNWSWLRHVLTNFVFILGLFILMLLINWQIRNLGG